jgi:hypothetical protein
MRSWKTISAYSFAALLLGIFIYGASVDYYLANEFSKNISLATQFQSEALTRLFGYGVVQSVDKTDNSFTMSWPYSILESARSVTLTVTGDTDIEKEELEADPNGVYVGLSPLAPGTFSDITPGTNVAVIFQRSGNNFVATEILFGNPL